MNMRKLFLLILSFIFLGGAVTGSALLLSGCDSVQTETSGGDSQDEILNNEDNSEDDENFSDKDDDKDAHAYAGSLAIGYYQCVGGSGETAIQVTVNGLVGPALMPGQSYTFTNINTTSVVISFNVYSGVSTVSGYEIGIGTTPYNLQPIGTDVYQTTLPFNPSSDMGYIFSASHFYKVIYYSNGGSGRMDTDVVYTVNGSSYEIKDCEFTHGNIDFLGWATSSDGNVRYQPGDTIADGTILYAVWDLPTYTNRYYYRTSSGTTTSSKTQTHTGTFTTYTASDISGEYTSNGWSIVGWTTSTSSASYSLDAGERDTATSNGVFYAVSRRSVSIEYSTGSGSSVSDTTGYYQRWNQYGNRYSNPTMTISSTRPTRSGYTFKGWATSSGSSTVSYNPGGSYRFSRSYNQSASVTLYAVWEKSTYDATLNVKFVRNYGTYNVSLSVSGTGLTTRSISEGGTATFTYETDGSASSITVTVRETSPSPNYFYVGTSSTPTNLSSYSFTWSRNSDKTVNIYTEQRYTITYNGNGSTSGSTSPTYYRYNSWPKIASNGFNRTGYTFKGWSTSSTGSGVDYYPGNSYTQNGYPTLYAVWTRISYTITYNGNGHTGGNMNPTTKYYGDSVALSANAFTKTGYHFTGWATSSTGPVVYADRANYSSNSSIDLYAIWAVNTYYVSFQPNGASGSAYTQTFTWGVSTTLTANRFTRTGYNFLGWSVGSVSAGVSYGDMATVSNLTSSNGGTVYFYAQWEAKVQAKYDSVGGYWYVENGKIPQTKVTDSTLINALNSATTTGSNYYIAGLTLQARVYNGTEYCQWNGNWYEVEPIKWRLTKDSNQTNGYGTTTDINAVLAEIVFVGQYSSTYLGSGAGYSTTAVEEFKKNGIDEKYLVDYQNEAYNFGNGTTMYNLYKDYTNMFVASESEIKSVSTTTAIEFSDLAKDIIKSYGGTNVYFTRDLGSNYNNITCFNEVGVDSQRFATDFRGVQFTIRFTEYACVD